MKNSHAAIITEKGKKHRAAAVKFMDFFADVFDFLGDLLLLVPVAVFPVLITLCA